MKIVTVSNDLHSSQKHKLNTHRVLLLNMARTTRTPPPTTRLNILLVVWTLIAGLSDAANDNSSSNETTNTISNPYYSGCLHQRLPGWTKLRVCSTRRQDRDDPQSAIAQGLLCRPPEFDDDYYMEIRIAVGNWASATALGWLTQIILSEIVGVPTSIESNMYGSSRDFYDPQSAIGTYLHLTTV